MDYKIYNTIFYFFFRLKNKFRRLRGKNSLIQSGENILCNNFKVGSCFSFLQIGANDGKSFDFIYDFVVKRKSKGIAIEPVPEYFNQLSKNYAAFDGIVPLNVAIHPTEKKVEIYFVERKSLNIYPDWVKGIASLDRNHLIKNGVADNHLDTVLVSAISINELLTAYNINYRIDLLQIDTEGFDYEILKMFDFSTFKPKIIRFESINLNFDEKLKAKKLLEDSGYHHFTESGDSYAVDTNRIKMF